MRPLDDDLWAPSAIGVIGPKGFLGIAESNRDHILYASLYDTDDRPTRVDVSRERRIDVLEDSQAISIFHAVNPLRAEELARDHFALDRSVATVGRLGPGTSSPVSVVILGAPWPDEPRILSVELWHRKELDLERNDSARRLMVSIARVFQTYAVKAGFVALLAAIPDERLRGFALRAGRFKRLRDVVQMKGIGALVDQTGVVNEADSVSKDSLILRVSALETGEHICFLQLHADGAVRRLRSGMVGVPEIKATKALLADWSEQPVASVLSAQGIFAELRRGSLDLGADVGAVSGFFWTNEVAFARTKSRMPRLDGTTE